ncbi:MAG: SMI1/KNR4 family protein, partial [Planctomycetes bacterium]|nr:SMI1/KNR4 family protein [Planctomycetota bacterium]
MTKLRNLRELLWRRKGPPLPASVLEAAKLKIDPDSTGKWILPAAYRAFLSNMDGGRPGVRDFTHKGTTFEIEAFYTFADAAQTAERLRKASRLPEGYLPVAVAEGNRPLVFVELNEKGKVWIRTNHRAAWTDKKAVMSLAKNFSDFLDMLGSNNSSTLSTNMIASPWGPIASRPSLRRRAPDPKPVEEKKATKKATTKKKATKKKATKKATTKKATTKKATTKKATTK